MRDLEKQYRDIRISNRVRKVWHWLSRIAFAGFVLIGIAQWIWSDAWLNTVWNISAWASIVAFGGFILARITQLETAMPLILDTLAEHEEAEK